MYKILKYVDEVLCGLCIYMYYCVFVFCSYIRLLVSYIPLLVLTFLLFLAFLFLFLSFLFLFSSALIPVAGVTLCVYRSVGQQLPVEITLWAVLIYLFCKLFFVFPVTVWHSVISNFRCYFFVLLELYGILIVVFFCL
jgi:hypothetical protein